MSNRNVKRRSREEVLIRQVLEGHKLGETEMVECSDCRKNLHGGDDVVVTACEKNGIYTVGDVNCGSCGTEKLQSAAVTVQARLAVVSDYKKQKQMLELFRVSGVEL